MTGIKINKVLFENKVEYWFDTTDILQSMIGDCIQKAEILVVEDSEREEALDNLDIACRTANTLIKEFKETGVLQFNCMTLRITFKEGQTVSFTNQTFGSISKGL